MVRAARPRRDKVIQVYSAIYSTDDVAPDDGCDYWRGVLNDKFRTSFERAAEDAPYRAEMACHSFDGFTMARMRAGGQRSTRTARHIGADERPYFMAGVVISGGNGHLEQGGRAARLRPRSVTYWDTSRPASWHFHGPHDVLLLRMPHERAALYSPTRALRENTAGSTSGDGAVGVAADFFLRLAAGAAADPAGTQLLARQGAGILASALALMAGAAQPSSLPEDDLLREQVLSHLRGHLADPTLTPDSIARAVNISRRSLYRLFETGEDSVMSTLRRLRVERAKQLLVSHRHRTLRDIGASCGFSDGQFSRAFRELVAMSPADYRAAHVDGSARAADGS